jgi:prepilin-type N-terminal cleavage/methylation domain-containing protein
MKSHNILTRDKSGLALSSSSRARSRDLSKGFTLVEILIVIGLISFFGVMGVIVGIDTYQRYIFRSDVDKVVALLQKARSSAVNNVNKQKYGVYLGDTSNFILFRGTSYNPSDTFNYKVERSRIATSTNTCTGGQVIFDQLTGNIPANCEIVIAERNKVSTTTINMQGGINY